MPEQGYGFDYSTLPKLPNLQEVMGSYGNLNTESPEKLFNLLQTPQGTMSVALPALQEFLLGSQSPAVAAIRQGAQSNVASTQSDMMRRELTGSDIETSAMMGARAKGEAQVGQLLAQQSQILAQYIMEAMGMDIKANREQFQTLAQALGQELSSRRDAEMFRQSMQENRAAEGRAHLAGQQGGLVNLVSSMIQGNTDAMYSGGGGGK